MGKIREMGKFFRKWYLLARIRRKHIQGSAGADIHAIANNLLWMEKSRLLDDIAEYKFFIFRRSKTAKNIRASKDNAILDDCLATSPPLLVQSSAQALSLDAVIPELSGSRSGDAFLRITGRGDEFSDISNFLLVHLPLKYKWLGPALIALGGLVWATIFAPRLLP